MTWLTKKLITFLELDKYVYEKVSIKKDVIDEIITLSKKAYPKEFLAFLDGEVKNKTLTIKSLLYQIYQSSKNAAAPKIDPSLHSIGTVHSHPSYNNEPSKADLQFFNRQGSIHLIICRPYTEKNIKAYGSNGNIVDFEVEE